MSSEPYRGAAAAAAVAGLVNGATMVVGASAVGWSTDHLVVPALAGHPVPDGVWCRSAGFILGVSALRWSTIFVRGVASGRVQYRGQARTRKSVVRRYLALNDAWHRRHSPGKLLAHAIADVDALWAPMQFFYFAAGMVFMLLFALTELFVRDSALGVTGLALVVLVLGLNILYQRLLAPRAREAQAARGTLGGIAHESIEADPVVRGLGLAGVEDARFRPAVERLRDADLRIAGVGSFFDPLLELLPTAAVLAVLAIAAPRVEHGSLSVGDLVGVVYLLITISIPLNVISRFLSMLPMSGAGRDRIRSVLRSPDLTRFGTRTLTGSSAPTPPTTAAGRTPPTTAAGRTPPTTAAGLAPPTTAAGLAPPTTAAGLAPPTAAAVSAPAGGLHVEVRGAGRLRLAGVDLTLEPGSVTLVTGPVGSGKTTLLDLAGGQHHPTSGVVLFDGLDVRTLAEGVVPANVAVVSQNPFLFATTLRDNLFLNLPYDPDTARLALRAAAAEEIVRELPDGLDTVVGERGATLSGGQRLRICLARALVRAPRLLVLDDATSALDPRVEREVLDGLATLVRSTGMTLLIATSRPHAITFADRTLTLASPALTPALTPTAAS